MKKQILIIIFFVGIFFGLAGKAEAATYYVDKDSKGGTCNDTNAGTISSPWCTIYKANITLVAGDTVYIRGGTYIIGADADNADRPLVTQGIHPYHSGSAGNPITYTTYNSEAVTFNAQFANLPFTAPTAIIITGKNYIKVLGTATAPMTFDGLYQYLVIGTGNGVCTYDNVASSHNEIAYCDFGYSYLTNHDWSVWQANHSYTEGDIVYPTNSTGNYQVATSSGTSGSTEPIWNNYGFNLGSIPDGTMTWVNALGLSWRSSTIDCSSTYNWVHNCTFHDFGSYEAANAGEPGGYDGAVLFEIGNDSVLDPANYNVIENNTFFHGGHHTIGIESKYNIVRNNIIHNEQWKYELKDGVWHSHRQIVMAADFLNNDMYNVLEGNSISHGGQPMTQQNPGEAIDLIQSSDIIRYNSFYAQPGLVISFNNKPVGAESYNHLYNNTFFASGYGCTYPGISNFPARDYHDRRAIIMSSGDHNSDTWPRRQGNVFKNNLFWKNYGYTSSDPDQDTMIVNTNMHTDPITHLDQSNYIWTGCTQGSADCPQTSIWGDTVIANNLNWAGVAVNPKFTSEGDYSNPVVNNSNIEWYWGSLTPTGQDITTVRTQPTLTLQATSPAIDYGTNLTTATNSGNNSTSLAVADAYYFQPGWGNGAGGGAVVNADTIAIGDINNVVQISAINYDTKTITLASAKTWSNNDPIWLYKDSSGKVVLSGSAPDAGAHEYGATPACTTPGDFDCNTKFEATDIQTMINIILGIEKDSAKISQADINNTKTVDAQDLQILINKVLGIN